MHIYYYELKKGGQGQQEYHNDTEAIQQLKAFYGSDLLVIYKEKEIEDKEHPFVVIYRNE